MVATIPVNGTADFVDYDPGNGYMYVNTLVIDPSTDKVIGTSHGVGTGAYDPDNGDFYFVGNREVLVFDPSTNTQTTIPNPAGKISMSAAYDPDNKELYVPNFGSTTISIINTQTQQVITTIPAGGNGTNIAVYVGNNHVYVTNNYSNTVSVIDTSTNTVIATIPVGKQPNGIAYDPIHGQAYVANNVDGTVSVINTKTQQVIATITVLGGAQKVAYNPYNGEIYVTNQGSNTVSVIDTTSNTIIATIPVGLTPDNLATDPNNGQVFVANTGDNTISIIAPTPLPAPIANAGSNQQVQSSQTVTLNGSASSDPSGFTPLTYNWTQTSGPSVSLSDPTSATPSFVAPQVTTNTDITFQLVVTNTKNIQSSPSFVTITVEPLSNNGGNGGAGGNAIQQKIKNLLSEIDSIPSLSIFTKSSLESPLKVTITLLNNNNHQTPAACFTMKAFLQIVNINENAGHLSHQQAAELKQQAINIQKAMGCFSLHPFPFSNGGGGDDNDNNDHRINNNNLIKPFNDDDRIDNR